MLYDKRWDKQITKADPRELTSLIAWLERQPCDGPYDFSEPSACLLAQYLKFHGEAHYCLMSDEALAYFGDDGLIIRGMKGRQGCADRSRWTFGAALERARAALESQR